MDGKPSSTQYIAVARQSTVKVDDGLTYKEGDRLLEAERLPLLADIRPQPEYRKQNGE